MNEGQIKQIWTQNMTLLENNFDVSAYPITFEISKIPRDIEITDNTGLLSSEMENVVQHIAEWKVPPVGECQRSEGRTIYFIINHTREQVNGLKIKGVAGIQYDSNKNRFILSQPRPHEEYGENVPHIDIDENLNFRTAYSSPKGTFSISHKAAKNEFNLQNQLAGHALALCGIMVGIFKEEKDFKNQETGFVVIEFDPNFVGAHRITDFQIKKIDENFLFNISGEMNEYISKKIHTSDPKEYYKALINNFVEKIEQMARIKYEAADKGKLARHSGDTANFYINPNTDEMKLTDLDSAKSYNDIPKKKWGAQLLRDMSMDLFKNLVRLTCCAYYGEGLDDELKRNNPFKAYFKGFLGDEYNKLESYVDSVSEALIDELFEYFKKRQDTFDYYYQERNDNNEQLTISLGKWAFLMNNFKSSCLTAIYAILTRSEKTEKFNLKNIKILEFQSIASKYIEDSFKDEIAFLESQVKKV